MKNLETEINAYIAATQAEVEAQAWNMENPDRRNSFMTRRLAALALEDTDPYTEDVFEAIAA